MTDFPAPYAVEVALSRRNHERLGHRRTDEAWLAEVWADPTTRVLVMAAGRVEATPGRDALVWSSPDHVPPGQRILLGELEGSVRFTVFPERSFRAPESWVTLREVGPLLGAVDLAYAIQALALNEWHRGHRFCPRCGEPVVTETGGYVLRCTGCARQQFPRTDPAVIMLVTDGDRALLGRQPSWPEGRYSTLAGFVDPGESLEQAVAREVMEEVGVGIGDVQYFGNQPWPFPQSLMIGFFAQATSTEIDVDGDEIEAARWFTRAELRAEAEAGTLALPGGFSISRSLIEAWFGAPLPGSW